MMFTLYWCILNNMCYSLCDSIAVSFLIMATRDLQYPMICTSVGETVVMECLVVI